MYVGVCFECRTQIIQCSVHFDGEIKFRKGLWTSSVPGNHHFRFGKSEKKKKSFIRNSFALRWINNYPRPSGTNGPRGGSAMSISPGSGTTMHVQVRGHIGQPRCRARAARAARAQAQGTETLPQHGGFQEVRTHVLTSKSGSSSRSTAGKLFGTDGAKLLDHNERYPSMKMASNLEGKKNSSNQIFQEIQE